MNKVIRVLFGTFCLALMLSCGNDKPIEETEEIENETSEAANDIQKIATQNIFNSVPSSAVVADMIERSGAEYDGSMLNNPDNYNKYTSDDYKALNLGTYGIDLSYTSIFEQTQESMLFLKCVNRSCTSLGISGVFDEKTVDRITANKENKDSLVQIISKSFGQADAFLKENQRAHTSSLMVAGGWIEGMYLAVNIAKLSPDKKIREKIMEQKSSLKDLIALLGSSKIAPDVAFVLDDLKKISSVFEIPLTPETEVKKDTKESTPTVDQDLFVKALDEKISALRKRITMN